MVLEKTLVNRFRFAAMALVPLGIMATTTRVLACGGFFCQAIPINQAGEQIIFRQDGNMVTAVVLIQYQGDAADFSWVVPVPGIPELSTGSDLAFAPLELATRPRFNLETIGAPCIDPNRDGIFGPVAVGGSADSANEDDGVEVLETLVVGPFDIEIVSSEDAEALAAWLEVNNYDLSDRGRDLIAPYVDEEMNFVALKLRQDQGVGDLQPLIMRYESGQPMIPIRLTAVAAQPDMGVIVWLLGESRAVPLNYLHVTPNYTRLNWYFGTFAAYASYQGLITAAMDEAGGQGFATDYAGRDLDVLSRLPAVEALENELVRLSTIADDASFVAGLAGGFVFSQTKVLEILRRRLTLPEGEGEFVYQVPELLSAVFTPEELASARADIVTELHDDVIVPLSETLAVFDGDPYMTRLYTTLSAHEMTLDPIFSFNPGLDDQGLDRNATLESSCTGFSSRWTLTLGAGTGREGEVVIDGFGSPPSFTPPIIDQDSVWRTEWVPTSGSADVVTQKQFPVAQIIGDDASSGIDLCGAGIAQCGAGMLGFLMFTMFGLRSMRQRR
jgi:hypothetical protein